jgi:exosortase
LSASESAEVRLPGSIGELITPSARIRIAVVALLLLLVYWGPIRTQLVLRWLNEGNWSHGWLIPLFSLYFLVTRRERLLQCRPRPSYAGAVVLVLSLTAYFVSAWILRMAYPQALSIVGAIFGVTLLLGGWSVIRVAWFPILFLVFAIPLPQALYVDLTMPLREFASLAAATIMPVLVPSLYTEAQAVVIDYVMPGMPPGTLNVEEACSGMRLMMAFVALGVAVTYLEERPVWQQIIMVLSCIPIAVFCNTVRVTSTGLLYVHGHHELARGTPHQLLGILMLLIALGLFLLIGYVLNRLFVEEPEEGKTGSASA